MEGLRLVARPAVARYAGPAAFLLAATAVVLVVRATIHPGAPAASARPALVKKHVAPRRRQPVPVVKQWYVIQSGDTLGAIASHFAQGLADLLRLNPGIQPTALIPGQQIRVK